MKRIYSYLAEALILLLLFSTSGCLTAQIPATALYEGDATTVTNLYWTGHLHPDSDTICSAIAAADIYGGTAACVGPLNRESLFILDYFDMPAPCLTTNFAGKRVGIVDFNQTTQLQESIDPDQIVAVIDHHALRDNAFHLPRPISITILPWGSAATIIAYNMLLTDHPIKPGVAGILMAAILSDTLLLTSPTTTAHDHTIVDRLARIAGIDDIKKFGMDMLHAKSNLEGVPAEKIITMDFKQYEINGKKIGFGVAETIEPKTLLKQKQALLDALRILKQEQSYDYLFFAIVDIYQKESYLLCVSSQEERLAKEAYGCTLTDQMAALPNMISRKSNLIPPIQQALSKND